MISLILIFFSFILLLTATNLIKCFSACCLYFCSKSLCYQLICSTFIQCIFIVCLPHTGHCCRLGKHSCQSCSNEAYFLVLCVLEKREQIVQEEDNLMAISTMKKIREYFKKKMTTRKGDYFRKAFQRKCNLC